MVFTKMCSQRLPLNVVTVIFKRRKLDERKHLLSPIELQLMNFPRSAFCQAVHDFCFKYICTFKYTHIHKQRGSSRTITQKRDHVSTLACKRILARLKSKKKVLPLWTNRTTSGMYRVQVHGVYRCTMIIHAAYAN